MQEYSVGDRVSFRMRDGTMVEGNIIELGALGHGQYGQQYLIFADVAVDSHSEYVGEWSVNVDNLRMCKKE